MGLKERLKTHLTHIARERDPCLATGGRLYVQHYIHQQLEQWAIVETYKFEARGTKLQNVVVNLPHITSYSRKQMPTVLIEAHYDAVPGSPGADDN